MFAIAKKEFISMFKSFKSVAIILLFVVVSMSIAKFVQNNQALLEGFNNQSNPYLSGMRFLINVLGFLFVLTLSHDSLNREIENQTIRFLVTKTSKMAIVIGKYLGIFLFWMTCVGISFVLVTIVVRQFFILDLLQLLCFLGYAIGLNMIITTTVRKTTFSMFISLFCGILLPVIGIWSSLSSNTFMQIFKYVLPYYYVLQQNRLSYVPILFSILFLLFSIYMFRRKDL